MKKKYYLLVLLLFFSCISSEKREKEILISKIEKKIGLEKVVEDYDPNSLTTEERLSKISEFIESEYNGEFSISPRLGYSVSQIPINDTNAYLRVVLDYCPTAQDVNMNFIYKKNNQLIDTTYRYNNGFMVTHIPEIYKKDSVYFDVYYKEKLYGSLFINTLKK